MAISAPLAAVIAASVIGSGADLPEVQTARIERRSLIESKVTANGEVRHIHFINLTAEVSGRVTDKTAREKESVEGVFTVSDDKAVFTQVEPWITGQNEIEITCRLGARQEIIIGPYRQLRMLNGGAPIRRNNDRAQSRI